MHLAKVVEQSLIRQRGTTEPNRGDLATLNCYEGFERFVSCLQHRLCDELKCHSSIGWLDTSIFRLVIEANRRVLLKLLWMLRFGWPRTDATKCTNKFDVYHFCITPAIFSGPSGSAPCCKSPVLTRVLCGGPGQSPTADLRVRSALLYATELPGHVSLVYRDHRAPAHQRCDPNPQVCRW